MKWKKIILLICIYIILTASIAICLSILQDYYLIRSGGVIAQPPEYSFEGPASYVISKNGMYILAINSEGQVEFFGTDAATVIQNAIDATGEEGGGKILLKDCVYDLTTYLNFKEYSYITLQGESWNTVLKTNDGPFNAISFQGIISNPNVGCKISDLKIDGGATVQTDVWNQQNGIQTRYTQDSTFERLFITKMGRTAIYNTEFSHRNFICNNLYYQNYRYGISYTSSSRGRVIGNYIKENNVGMNWDATYGENYYTLIQENIFENNSIMDLYIVGTSSNPPMYGVISGNSFHSSASVAQVKAEFAEKVDIVGNLFHRSGYSSGERHLYLQESQQCNVIGNIITGEAYIDLEIGKSSDILVSDNSFLDIDGRGIRIWADAPVSSDRNIIKDNVFRGTSGIDIHDEYCRDTWVDGNDLRELTGNTIIDSGTETTINNNRGYP